jgi:hypothetical protein
VAAGGREITNADRPVDRVPAGARALALDELVVTLNPTVDAEDHEPESNGSDLAAGRCPSPIGT